MVNPDGAGRLQISKDLVGFASLSKNVVIASAGELFEIWDKEAYEEVIASGALGFAEMAEMVMGNTNENE